MLSSASDTFLLELANFSHSKLFIFLALTLVPVILFTKWSLSEQLGPKAQKYPKTYRYFLPYIGHSFSILFDYSNTLTTARKHFNDTRQPFFLLLKGVKTCIVTDPQDADAIHKNHHVFSRVPFLSRVCQSFGISKQGLVKFEKPAIAGAHQNTPRQQKHTLLETTFAIARQRLSPKPSNEPLLTRYLECISAKIQWKSVLGDEAINISGDSAVVSLASWTQKAFAEASARALLGDIMLQLDSTFLKNAVMFDEKTWMLFAEIPRPWSSSMWRDQKAVMATMNRYFALSLETKKANSSQLIEDIEVLLDQNDISREDTATLMALIFSATFTNTWKVCFWLLTYIVYDAELLQALRQEILTVSESPENHVAYAAALAKCPLLCSTFNETLRMTAATGSWRNVASGDARIGGYTIKQGTTILIPSRDLHMSSAFNPDCESFKPDRFLRGTSLTTDPSFRPWGGGAGICPGRFVAQAQVLSFVALVLRQYDVERADKFVAAPRVNDFMPSAGIMGPADGQDVLLRLKPFDSGSER